MIAGSEKLHGLVILAALLLAACGEYSGSDSGNSFAWDMRGTWKSNDQTVISGTLVIDRDTITISGYNEAQAYDLLPDPNQLPFKNFTKGAALSAYSVSNEMYIHDKGAWQSGIPYTNYTTGTSSANRQEFLLFNFGGREERLQKIAEY
ncbi:MAG: hypothetical protein LBC99_10180 [Spirochaetota bacterium]|jgi:hypothetical protein|nr:hypothetical protein [Spirochaetota bacterium]